MKRLCNKIFLMIVFSTHTIVCEEVNMQIEDIFDISHDNTLSIFNYVEFLPLRPLINNINHLIRILQHHQGPIIAHNTVFPNFIDPEGNQTSFLMYLLTQNLYLDFFFYLQYSARIEDFYVRDIFGNSLLHAIMMEPDLSTIVCILYVLQAKLIFSILPFQQQFNVIHLGREFPIQQVFSLYNNVLYPFIVPQFRLN